MSFLRPTNLSPLQPTIRDLSSFLLSPRSYQTGCAVRAIRRRIPSQTIPSPYITTSRNFNTVPTAQTSPKAPRSHDRGPKSSEDTQTDFGALDVLGNTPAPSTSIDACLWDGFHLNSGVKIVGGSGALLVAGDAFSWKPWESITGERKMRMVNEKGQFEVPDEAWGLLELVWPKPDLLILGLGRDMRPISPKTRERISSLGIRVDIQDTRNAAAQFNLLATERGVGTVAAALIPLGWQEGLGIQ